MLIKDCFKGQRVVFKENGKPATILSVSHTAGKITIAFDNAERKEVSSSALDPAGEEASRQTETGVPMRPCPQCATKMPTNETVCPNCGFRYGVKKSSSAGKIFKTILLLAVLAVAVYAVWKYVWPMIQR
jgi:predicted nucleic acid-binding Zn ribbon protein